MWFALRFSIRQKPLNWTMKQCHFRKIDRLRSAEHPIPLCPAHWVLVWLAIHCITVLRYGSSTRREWARIMFAKIKEVFKLVMGQCTAGLLIKAEFSTEEEILCLTYTDAQSKERFGVQLCPVQLSRNQEMCREGPKCNQQRHPVPFPAWCWTGLTLGQQ